MPFVCLPSLPFCESGLFFSIGTTGHPFLSGSSAPPTLLLSCLVFSTITFTWSALSCPQQALSAAATTKHSHNFNNNSQCRPSCRILHSCLICDHRHPIIQCTYRPQWFSSPSDLPLFSFLPSPTKPASLVLFELLSDSGFSGVWVFCGFQSCISGPPPSGPERNNLLVDSNSETVSTAILKELKHVHTAGPFESHPFPFFFCSPIGAAPKKDVIKHIILHPSHSHLVLR